MDLRLAAIDSVSTERLERYRGWFTATEHEQYDGFRSERRCREFVVGRGLLRTALAAQFEFEPRQFEFAPDAQGKLFVQAPRAACGAHFNISHTRDVVVCATCTEYPVGVDIERIVDRIEPLQLAQRFFSASETRVLAKLMGSLQLDRFFTMWTLKEALVKAHGLGVFASTQTTHFDINEAGTLEASSWEPQFRDAWLATAKPSPQHRLAVCVLCPDGVTVHVRLEGSPAVGGDIGALHWFTARLENRPIQS